jgi:hypothetical protein
LLEYYKSIDFDEDKNSYFFRFTDKLSGYG